MKLTLLQKLELAKEYDTGNIKLVDLCKKWNVTKDKVQYSYKLYKMWGEKPFLEKDKPIVYTREEKLKAIQIVLSKEKSCRQLSLEKGFVNPRVIMDWVYMYQKYGESAIQNSRSRKSYKLHEDRQKYLAEKELKERLKFLEMENEYLKKSLALGSKKSKLLKRK